MNIITKPQQLQANCYNLHIIEYSNIFKNKKKLNSMVLLHYKKTDHNQFLYEVPGDTLIAQVIAQLVQINNLRIQLDIFACSIQELALKGPLKPQETRGLQDQELVDNALVIADPQKKKWAIKRQPVGDQLFTQDPTHYRIGVVKNKNITDMMLQTSTKAKMMISYKRVDMKQKLDIKELQQMKQQLKAALKIAYPGYEGLGSWQPALQISQDQYFWEQMNTDQIDYLSPKASIMWWAGKQLHPEKPLNFYTGKNQKTKIIVKLTKTGSGAPMRQAPIDEQTKIKLMGMYHRKQEQLKKIQSNNQDDFAHSTWANPNNLKSYLVGGGKGINWKAK